MYVDCRFINTTDACTNKYTTFQQSYFLPSYASDPMVLIKTYSSHGNSTHYSSLYCDRALCYRLDIFVC